MHSAILEFWPFCMKIEKLSNIHIFDKGLNFLTWISWLWYLRVRHVEFSSKLFLVWVQIRIYEFSTAILYGKFNRSRISANHEKDNKICLLIIIK
jgi:hypothetical protein